jgi:hypothetical protein
VPLTGGIDGPGESAARSEADAFEALLARQESGELSQAEAGEMLGVTERTFRRWRDRLRDDGVEGLVPRFRATVCVVSPGWLVLQVEELSEEWLFGFREQRDDQQGMEIMQAALPVLGSSRSSKQAANRSGSPRCV